MLCRIEIRRELDRVIVHPAGRLSAAQVPALIEACAEAGGQPILELDELVSTDAVGLDALMRIERQGATLLGLPEYLRLKMDVLTREHKE